MKSSTIRRSTLSRETMEVIENLAKEQEENGLPNEYVRPEDFDSVSAVENNGMSQEIDLLWQNFKPTQLNTNSPILNVFIGVVIGVILTLTVIFCLNSFSGKSVPDSKLSEPSIEQQTAPLQEDSEAVSNTENMTEQTEAVSSEQVDSSSLDTSKMTKYVIKSGDTVESIIKNHYGVYSEEKAELVKKANNLSTLDRINIDQELLLP